MMSLYYGNPVEILSFTKEIRLLSLEQIKHIARTELAENFEKYTCAGEKNRFTKMELTYFRYTDKEQEGIYTFVPAWRLEGTTNQRLLINAVDGSVIDVIESMEIEKE